MVAGGRRHQLDLVGTLTDSASGDAAYLSTYETMANVLESGELPGAAALPGLDTVTQTIRQAIDSLG